MAMGRTAAIRAAAKHVSISGHSTSWHIYGPYRRTELRGPSTELTADSYSKALRIRTAWRARIALALIERLDNESALEVDRVMYSQYDAAHDIRTVVSAAARQFGTGPMAAEIAEAVPGYGD